MALERAMAGWMMGALVETGDVIDKAWVCGVINDAKRRTCELTQHPMAVGDTAWVSWRGVTVLGV
jgi:hypothetical protein